MRILPIRISVFQDSIISRVFIEKANYIALEWS